MIAIYEHGNIVEANRVLGHASAAGTRFFRCGRAGALWSISSRERRDTDEQAELHVTLEPVHPNGIPLTHPVLELPLPQRVGESG